MLSDTDILRALNDGTIEISPFSVEQLQPASYDVRLGPVLKLPAGWSVRDVYSLTKPPEYEEVDIRNASYELRPDEFVLASVNERIFVSRHYACRIEGKSSIGRLGLAVHITAGFVDPGWNGNLTLEIKNQAPYSIELSYLMPISQISFSRMDTPTSRPYRGRYQGAKGVEGPKA